jgi:D-glycero-D-manno-heptose 1,7-bisphosphate phosphatase
MKPVPVLYLDLDGTVRKGYDELGRFVNTAADVEVFPTAVERMREAKKNSWRIVGVTNQGGIALGILSMEDAAAAIYETQRQCDGLFDKILMCQHHPDAKDPEYAVCWCRKPRIGNVVLAARELCEQYPDEYYPPHLALFVGDRPEDQGCADNAGIRFMDAKEWRVS